MQGKVKQGNLRAKAVSEHIFCHILSIFLVHSLLHEPRIDK